MTSNTEQHPNHAAPNLNAAAFEARNGLAYGLLGLPLAFVALPLYVIFPNYYAREFGVSLAGIGGVLLTARLLDAVIDPALGRLSDRLFGISCRHVLGASSLAALMLALGFALLFFPAVRAPNALMVWAFFMLILTYTGYSALGIFHQSWGARLGGNENQRTRVVAWREAWGLIGVMLAAVVPVWLGFPVTTALLFVALICGLLTWRISVRPQPNSEEAHKLPASSSWLPFQQADFRRLLAVFMLNGIASAVPATLVLFFIQDRLAAPTTMEPLFLGTYFLCAALSIPFWTMLVKHIGLARSWLTGMLLSIAVFAWAGQIGAGQYLPFLTICALSGMALGSDLALPSALLAGVIQKHGQSGRAEGTYFGWWNFATKLNLALGAGLTLPLLGLLGYTPGTREPQALHVLTLAYCALPCFLKTAAAISLYFFLIQPFKKATP